ncbi:Uncharacterised protein [Staphylococcus gallinarum]|uniref:Uncharacterized protein n=1 Tax=Staphylococcus gallinarum TaxID=1293 RepID=A0A380FD86_STAGA|nr:Uncharacterised protein [Staphylococcus gallinarum]
MRFITFTTQHHLTLTQLMNVYNQHDYHIENIQWNDFMDFLMECIEQGIKSDEINDFLITHRHPR